MVKFLISLMFLASSWAWGAEVLPHGGVVETKAEMVTLARGEDSFMVSPDRLAPFEMLRAGFAANGFEESHSGLMQLDHEVINKLQYDFLKLYLEDSEAALASLASYNGDQIVDIMVMLDYLNRDLDHPEIQKLNSILVEQLLGKLSPDVLQKLFQKLRMEPGLNLSQTIPGLKVSWSPDGSKLWVHSKDDGIDQIKIYQIINDRLTIVDQVTLGFDADWSPDGSRLLVWFIHDDVEQVQMYKVDKDGLESVGATIPEGGASWNSDGSKLLMAFKNADNVDQFKIYQVTKDGLESAGETVDGWDAVWSPDGSRLLVQSADHDEEQIRLYQVVVGRLEPFGNPVPGFAADWSPDGSKLWVLFSDHDVERILLYKVVVGGLEPLGAGIPGSNAGWSPDGSKLCVKFKNTDDVNQIRVYQVADEKSETDEWLVAMEPAISGSNADWVPDGSKLFVTFKNHDVDQTRQYQITAEGLVEKGAAVLGDWIGWSLNGTKLWVKFIKDDLHLVCIYRITEEGLVAIGTEVSGYNLDWSPDGSKLWIRIMEHGALKIQVYHVDDDRLASVTFLGGDASWGKGGARLAISSVRANQVAVFFDMSYASLSLNQLLKEFISDDTLYQALSLVQQMFLAHVLQEHQKTSTAYKLPVELQVVWDSLSEELRSYLVEKKIIVINWPTVRSYAEMIAGSESGEDDVAHKHKK